MTHYTVLKHSPTSGYWFIQDGEHESLSDAIDEAEKLLHNFPKLKVAVVSHPAGQIPQQVSYTHFLINGPCNFFSAFRQLLATVNLKIEY